VYGFAIHLNALAMGLQMGISLDSAMQLNTSHAKRLVTGRYRIDWHGPGPLLGPCPVFRTLSCEPNGTLGPSGFPHQVRE